MIATAAERLARVRQAIAEAARASGRDPGDVGLVAVSKTFPASAIEELHRAGQQEFGENRVQEAEEKAPALPAALRWHLVGHLQANKAMRAVRLFAWIHSIDSAELARRLERLASEAGRTVDGLVQVDLAGEETKFGLQPAALPDLLREATAFRSLRLRGLMLLPPLLPDAEQVRPYFRRLRDLAAEMERRGLLGAAGRVELSMGMSNDFAVAVQEGATLLRVGTALFGERQ